MRAVIQGGQDGVEVLWERALRSPSDARIAARKVASYDEPVALTLAGLDRTPSWERVYDSTNAENLGAESWLEIERRVLEVMEATD